MYYFYRKSNRGHGICLLYKGCLPFGKSIIRGFTVDGNSELLLIILFSLLQFFSRQERLSLSTMGLPLYFRFCF